MQQFGPSGGTTIYEEASCFPRSEPGFSIEDNATASCSAFLGLDECLDRHLKSSGLTPLNELNPNEDSLIGRSDQSNNIHHHLDFELEDNGQLLHDMLQQQQQVQHHHLHQQQAIIAPSSTQQQSAAAASWEESIHVLQEMLLLQQHQALQCPPSINDHPSPSFPSTLAFTNSTIPNISTSTAINPNGSVKFPGESELLSLLQLPRCASSSMASSIESRKLPVSYNAPHANIDPLGTAYHGASIDYDPQAVFLHQQAPPGPSLSNYQVSLKHLFHNGASQNHIHAANIASTSTSTLVHHINVGSEDKETTATFSIDDGRQFASQIFDFKRVESTKGEPRGINHFATERQRREYLNEKYQTLRSLVPNPTKADRASIVQDAIEYVKELKRTVQELQVMVQERNRQQQHHHHLKKRKLHSSEESCCLQGGTGSCANVAVDLESTSTHGRAGEGSCVGLLRSSFLQRTSQVGTHVDVRIVEEDVNIKLTQKRRAVFNDELATLQAANAPRGNPLLLDIVVALHELQLDLLSANGATIGDHHVFTLNTKVMDGSATYAGQVATKLIEAIDRQVCNNFAPPY